MSENLSRRSSKTKLERAQRSSAAPGSGGATANHLANEKALPTYRPKGRMRYSKDHKEKTRRHVVETASRAFRRDGIQATGLIGLMNEAGLTQGAFYNHFDSKDALIAEAVGHATSERRRAVVRYLAKIRASGGDLLQALVDGYLKPEAVTTPGASCAFGALGSELPKQAEAVRRICFAEMNELIEVIESTLDGSDRERATALLALFSGTMQMARLAPTSEEAESILEAGRRAAMAFAKS